MLLSELTTSNEKRIAKINSALQEAFGFTLNSNIDAEKIAELRAKVSDHLYKLKLNNASPRDAEYVEKVLVKEGLDILHESAMLAGPGGRAMERVVGFLADFVRNACEVGDDYEEAIYDAMKQYRSSKYRFGDDHVEFELRKLTADCDPLEEGTLGTLAGAGIGAAVGGPAGAAIGAMAGNAITGESVEEACEEEQLDEIAPVIAAAGRAVAGGIGKMANTAAKAAGAAVGSKLADKALGEDDLEEEQLDELEKDTYSSYMQKAGQSGEQLGKQAAAAMMMGDEDAADAHMKQMAKRSQGMYRALNSIITKHGNDPKVKAIMGDLELARAMAKSNYEEIMDELDEELEEANPDRYAERDWVRGIQKDQAKQSGDQELELSLVGDDDDDGDDYFSYNRKKGMKEGYVKQLRKLLEAETAQAESLIAAKSFSQELQDMIEKLGRLVNEDLPAVAEQMRDSHGADVATGFEDTVSGTLNGIMDSLRSSKQELDNSVSAIADGGMPEAPVDMDSFDAEADLELDGEVDDLDLDADVELDLEPGDELGGMDAAAGPEDEELGRAKKESVEALKNKIVEMQEKIARAKKRKA